MRAVVFVGPTLTPEEGRKVLGAEILPPASQGDVYRVACGKPEAIGIIDGYFDRVPAVWHKEILWAMAQGIHVYGSASMGALRAAELSSFGMVGVGRIFEAFHANELEDDDEVAIAHGSEQMGYRAVSDAMVNIRATLTTAAVDRIASPATLTALLGIAKSTFYAERSYAGMLSQARDLGLPADDLERLREWLPRGRVNQKRDDAIAMLERMAADAAAGWAPLKVHYSFEHTNAWEAAARAHDQTVTPQAAAPEVPKAEDPIERLVDDELRLFGPKAVLRALQKDQMLRGLDLEAVPNGAELDESRALAWYFEKQLGRTLPQDLDGYALGLGMSSGAAFRQAVWREFVYVTCGEPS